MKWGEIQIKGRSRPVHVYSLESSDANYVEQGIVLMVTDLHRYTKVGEELAPHELNEIGC